MPVVSFYSADVYPGTGSQVAFPVTFDFLDRDTVVVYRIETVDGSQTELTVIQTGTPTGDEFIWDNDQLITVGTAPTTDQQLKVQRRTPVNEQAVQWKDGSYIIAEDLNTSEEQSLYIDQELTDWLGEITGGGAGPGDFVNLDNLGDVTITSPVNWDQLTFDATTQQWVNKTPTEITEATVGVDDLKDVDLTSSANWDQLTFDEASQQWVNKTPAEITESSVDLDDLRDATINSPQGWNLIAYDEATGDWVNKSPEEITENSVDLEDLRDVDDVITESDMASGDTESRWVDGALSTAGASRRYFENLYQEAPPDPNERYEQGKLWYQRYITNLGKEVQTFSIYDGNDWQAITAGEVVPNPFTPQSVLYVDPQGDDNNPGRRPDEAFRTIKRAAEVANTATPGTVSTVSTATYDNVSGFVNITTTANHNLISGITVTLSPIVWSCTNGQASFPSTSKQFRISAVTGSTTFRFYAGANDKVHTYVSGGVVTPKDARLGDGYTIRCAPGVYAEKFPIQVQAKNLAIIGSSLRNTYIHPDISGEAVAGQQGGVDIYPGELEIMFELDSGSYLTGFTFAGLKSLGTRGNGGIDPDPTYGLPPQQGWVAAHRQGAFITKSPYIQNCTHFSDLQTDNANFDPNFLAGEGGDTTSGPSGGGMLIDGERVDVSSPLRSFVVDSFTQISLGGPGVTCTNNGYAQLVSFFGTFCWYHAKSLNGGQLNLSNCTSDFGQYGLIADGKSASPIFSAALKDDVAAGVQFIELISFTKGTQWEPPREMTPLDHMVVEVNGVLYPILGSTQTATGYEVNIFSPLADSVADPDAFENGGLQTAGTAGNTCNFYLQSYISTGGHTMEFVGSGTDYRAHPDFGGVPEPANQTIEIGGVGAAGSRLSYINGGRIWLSSTDENGNFKVGETFTVNQKTGTIVILPSAVQGNLILKDDLDLRGYKIIQDPSTSGANTDIQLQPSGTGDVVFGTDDENADASRIGPAAILGPILEHNVEKDPSTAEITYDRIWPVVTQRDIGYDADDIPVSGLLGQLAFTDSAPSVKATQSPPLTNELTFEVSGTTLTIKYQPTGGGAVQTTTLTLS
jgi:hypothetical protein